MTSHRFLPCLFNYGTATFDMRPIVAVEISSRKKPGNVLFEDIHCPWFSLNFRGHCSLVFIFRKENKTIF